MQQTIDMLEQYFQQLPRFVREHSERVSDYLQLFINQMLRLQLEEQYPALTPLVRDNIGLLGRYHDIGKTGVDDELWMSTAPLTEDEQKLAHIHTILGAHLLRRKLWLPNQGVDQSDLRNMIADCCLYHHERWDGTGYPFELKEQRIPFHVRIISIADAFDAMTADRPYHAGISKTLALQEIRAAAGKQFDPALAEIFSSVFNRETTFG